MIDLAVFQFTLIGFDANTDETDHLIKWVAAPEQGLAEDVMKSLGFEWSSIDHIEEMTPQMGMGIDLVIGEELFNVEQTEA